MYIKKGRLAACAIVVAVAAAVLTLAAVNPFGIANIGELIRFSAAAHAIKDMYYDEVEGADYANAAIEGFAQGTGDPYTNFIYGDTANDYMEDVSGSFEGIGVYIENNTEDNTITVVSAISGTPAEEAGLVSGDKILMVAGESYTGEQLNEAVKKMKGQTGTTVDIQVLKAETGELKDITIERRHISIETVESRIIDGTGVGYISISQFTEETGLSFKEQLGSIISRGARSLVIDLRNNPGGMVDAAVDVASNFVKTGDEVVYTLDKNEKKVSYTSEGSQYYIPVAVLINQGSASASEILTGALKDYGLAYVIGEKSYGKGIVQSVFTGMGGIVSVTTARYYTPSGTCIHGIGIEPDEVIPMELNKYVRLSELSLAEDEQLSAAVKYLTQNK